MKAGILASLQKFFLGFIIYSFIFSFLIVATTKPIYSQSYGDGTYGSGLYGTGEEDEETPPDDGDDDNNDDENDSDDDGDDSDNECSDEVGIQPPWVYSAVAHSSSTILLSFTEAADPVDEYDIKYGTESGNYSFEDENIDVESESKMDYQVKNLKPNTTYFFRVRGVNGCAKGDWSNEIKTTTKPTVIFNNLQFTNSDLDITEVAPPPEVKVIEPEVNIDDFSGIDVPKELLQPTIIEIEDPNDGPRGYVVKVKVVDEQNNPVEGAKVTIHSEVQEASSDKDGVATFNNVEEGDHQVIIEYDGYKGEQAINLTGDVKEFSMEIKVTPQKVVTSPIYLWSVGIISVVVLILLAFLIMRRRR